MKKDHQSMFFSTVDSQKNLACLNKRLLDQEFEINEHIFNDNNKELQHQIEIKQKDQEIRHKDEKIKLLEEEINKKKVYLFGNDPLDDPIDFSMKSSEQEDSVSLDKSYFTQKTAPHKHKISKEPMQILIESLENKLACEIKQNQELDYQFSQSQQQIKQLKQQLMQHQQQNEFLEQNMNKLTCEIDNLNFQLYENQQKMQNILTENQFLKEQSKQQQKENEEKISDLHKNTTSLIEICEDAYRERRQSQIMFSQINQQDDLNKEIIDNLVKVKNNLLNEISELKNTLLQNKLLYQQKIDIKRQQNLIFVKKVNHIKKIIENFQIYNDKWQKRLQQKLQTFVKKILTHKHYIKKKQKKTLKESQNKQMFATPIKSQKILDSKGYLTYKKVHEYVDLRKHIQLIQKHQKLKQDTNFKIKKLDMLVRHLQEDLDSRNNSFEKQKNLLQKENERLVNEVIEKNLRFSLMQEEQEQSLVYFRKLVKKQNVRLKYYEGQIQLHNDKKQSQQSFQLFLLYLRFSKNCTNLSLQLIIQIQMQITSFLLIYSFKCLLYHDIIKGDQLKLFNHLADIAHKQAINIQERILRQQIFLENQTKVQRFNDVNKETKLGLNQFSIMTQYERNIIKAQNRYTFQQQIQEQRKYSLQEKKNQNISIFQSLINKYKNNTREEQFQSIQQYESYWKNLIKEFIEVIETDFDFVKQNQIKECLAFKNLQDQKQCIDSFVQFSYDQISQYKLKQIRMKNQLLINYTRQNFNDSKNIYFELQNFLKITFQNTYKIILDTIYNIKGTNQDKKQIFNQQSNNYWFFFNKQSNQDQTLKQTIPKDSLFMRMKNAGRLEKDWHKEKKVSSVKNQGQCGACWIFSAVSVIESQILLDRNQEVDLSEQQPLNCALEQEGSTVNACDGSLGHIAISSIKKTGIQLESELPYIAKDQKCKSLRNSDTRYDVQEHYFIKQTGNMEQFLNELFQRPLAVALYISDLFFDYKEGTIDCLSKNFYEGDSNNHEVLAVGYKIDLQNPEKSYIKFKNQWSTNWGENGYFKFKLYNEVGYISQKIIVGKDSKNYQEKLYLYFGPCGMLRSMKDTFWVKMRT